MVPPDSDRIPRVPPYSGYCYVVIRFRVRDYHSLWLNFPEYSTTIKHTITQSYNPCCKQQVCPFPLSLAATSRISFDFSSSGYWDVSLHRVSPPQGNWHHCQLGCPIRKSMDQNLLTVPHSLSQSSTSFIASYSLGIHHSLLIAYLFVSLSKSKAHTQFLSLKLDLAVRK